MLLSIKLHRVIFGGRRNKITASASIEVAASANAFVCSIYSHSDVMDVSEAMVEEVTFLSDMGSPDGLSPSYHQDATKPELSKWENIVIAVYMGILSVGGVALNVLIFNLFFSDKRLNTAMNVLFLSLTTSDGLTSVFGTFVGFVHVAGHFQMVEPVCSLYGFFTFLGGELVLSH